MDGVQCQVCDLWQDEEGIVQSEEETAEEMSSYESEDNQDQVGNKISTLKINTRINVFRTTSIAISFSSVVCQCLIVLQFSTCRRCRPKLLLYWLEGIMNCLHWFH